MQRLYLHISQKDLSQRNAETTHVLEVARAFSAAGRRVRVAVPGVGRCEVPVPFAIDYLPAVREPRFLRLLSYELALWAYMLTRPEVWRRRASLYVRKGTVLLAPMVLGRLLRLPVVLEVNGTDAEIGAHSHLGWGELAVLRCLSRLCYRLARSIVVPVSTLADELCALGVPRAKTVVVSNGVNADVFYPRDAAQCRRALGLREDARYVCYVGVMAPWQGVDVVLEAFARGARQCPDALLLLVGGGQMRRALERQAGSLGLAQRAIFRGPVPLQEVPQYIASATVCVVPVRVATHSPVKLFEYLACERPVIGSDVPGVREIVSGYDCGWLARAGDPDDWARNIAAALTATEQELAARGKRGRQAVQRNHTWEAAGRKILPLLDGLGEARA